MIHLSRWCPKTSNTMQISRNLLRKEKRKHKRRKGKIKCVPPQWNCYCIVLSVQNYKIWLKKNFQLSIFWIPKTNALVTQNIQEMENSGELLIDKTMHTKTLRSKRKVKHPQSISESTRLKLLPFPGCKSSIQGNHFYSHSFRTRKINFCFN